MRVTNTEKGCSVSMTQKALMTTFSLLIMALLAGCGSGGPRTPIKTEYFPFNKAEQELHNRSRSAEYKFHVGDTFAVDFKYEDDLDQKSVLVLPDGNITLSGVGVLPAAGYTITQVDSILTENYAKDYRNPELSILVQEIADQKIYVLGEVQKPGLVTLPDGGEGVLQAIAVAGGFTKHARRKEVLVIRVNDEGYVYRIFDLSNIQNLGLQEIGYLDLKPLDVVYVPKSSLGNLSYFSDTILANLLRVGDLFWDVYAVTHLDKVDRLTR